MKQYIAYYRVSTHKQGKSGLGLAAQKSIVHDFIQGNELLAEFTEIETGKNNRRPQLNEAIQITLDKKATLLVANLDRLSRNASFIFALRDAKVPFICCDMPDANSLTVGLMAVLAQDERERISRRTRLALEEKRKQSGEWRVSGMTDEHRKKGTAALRQKAIDNEHNKKAMLTIRQFLDDEFRPTQSLQKIAKELNEAGFRSSRGQHFFPMTVSRIIHRIRLKYQNES